MGQGRFEIEEELVVDSVDLRPNYGGRSRRPGGADGRGDGGAG